MRFHNLDLNLLVVLDALLNEQSVSKAARQLNLGQPAVSAALLRLREFFKDELLIQTGRTMAPTALARSLAAPVKDVLQRTHSIVFSKLAFDPASEQRSISVSCSDFSASVLLTPFSRELMRYAPGLQMQLRQTRMPSARVSNIVVESLERRGNDFAISPVEFLSSEHPFEPLFSDDYVAICWRDNTSIGKKLTLKQFESLSHVSTEFEEGRTQVRENKFMDQAGYRRSICASADTFTQVAELVVETERIAVLQRKLARVLASRLSLRSVELPFHIPPITECVQWKAFHDDDSALSWFRTTLIAFARDAKA